MPMLENLPSVEEMMIALSSPVIPEASKDKQADEMQLSTDDMIKEIFAMMNEQRYAAGQSQTANADPIGGMI
jgi:hypothetical protein